MRTWLKIWSVPIVFLVVWYVLSSNDLSFGIYMFSREMHDEFFRVYASVLGVEQSELGSLFTKGLLFDACLIGSFIAFRKRKVLIPFLSSLLRPAMAKLAR